MESEETCATCGRRIEWRKKWQCCWEQVKYCSDACRSRRSDEAAKVESAVTELLARRPRDASICPSEVARKLFPEDWRRRMEDVRRAARILVAKGEIEILQGGRVVDPSTAKGPIRLRRTH